MDSLGNVVGINSDDFTYDDQNRLLTGYGQTHAYDAAGRFTTFENVTVTADAQHPHGANNQNGTNRYDYDAAGNVVWRTNGSTNQTLTWSPLNELASVGTAPSGTPVLGAYHYDDTGERIREVHPNGSAPYTEYEFFPQYERFIASTGTAGVNYYYFGGARVAQRMIGGSITWLHGDHLGSTHLTTGDASSGSYRAYGRACCGSARR